MVKGQIQGVFFTGAPLKVLSVRLQTIKKVLSVTYGLALKFLRGAPVKKNTLYYPSQDLHIVCDLIYNCDLLQGEPAK